MVTQSQPQPSTPPTKLSLDKKSSADWLDTLRACPVSSFSQIHTLSITFTVSQILAWHGDLSPGVREVFDDEDLAELAHLYHWPSSSGPDPNANAADEFRKLLRFVADNLDLPNLRLEIDPGSSAWTLHDGKLAAAYDEDVEKNWRFVYEFNMDVGRALSESFGGKKLAGLTIRTDNSIYEFEGVGAWLEREITGKKTAEGKTSKVPAYHDTDKRLSTS